MFNFLRNFWLKPRSKNKIRGQNGNLAVAVSSQNYRKVAKCLIKGADVHDNEDFALRWASGCGYVEIVQLLLEHGADVHACNDYALRWASANNHPNIVKLLLEHGADVHAWDDWALDWASHNGYTRVIKLLEEYIDAEKKSPLD